MYEKLEVCPSCKNTNFKNYLICSDHSVSGESFALSKCTKCELVFTNPRPDEEALPKYYESKEYISHTNKANSFINLIYKIARHFTIRSKIKLINSYHNKGTILDYGCGTGHFLKSCESKGWTTYGYEPDKNARAIAESNGLHIIEKIKKTNAKYDIITAWHVIEHVSDLRKTIKKLRSALNENGHLIIAVPNIESYDARYYKENWAAYDVPRHLYHFNQKSFGKLIAKSKLTMVKTLPMKLDAYYISMISEKYINGKNNLLSALRIGRLSNKEAKKSGEYSSLIYILKK